MPSPHRAAATRHVGWTFGHLALNQSSHGRGSVAQWACTGATPAPHRASVARHVSWTSILWPLPSTRRTAAAVSRNGQRTRASTSPHRAAANRHIASASTTSWSRVTRPTTAAVLRSGHARMQHRLPIALPSHATSRGHWSPGRCHPHVARQAGSRHGHAQMHHGLPIALPPCAMSPGLLASLACRPPPLPPSYLSFSEHTQFPPPPSPPSPPPHLLRCAAA
jgi:hypothetical protein